VALLSALRVCSQFFMGGCRVCQLWRGGFPPVVAGFCQSGKVGFSELRGSAVQRVVRVRAKRHPNAQQVGQRDCPPFRLAKLVFFIGKRLRCKQSRGQPLTVTLGGHSKEIK